MNFDGLDAKMRVFETAHDHCVLPGIHVVARLDGRSFTRLTKEVHRFEAPFDARFRDMMVATVEHLMTRKNPAPTRSPGAAPRHRDGDCKRCSSSR